MTTRESRQEYTWRLARWVALVASSVIVHGGIASLAYWWWMQ